MCKKDRTENRIKPLIVNGLSGSDKVRKDGKNVILDLEGSCSIQLSYERKSLNLTPFTWEQQIQLTFCSCFWIASEMEADQKPLWQKTQSANLIRYVPSRTYYARIRIRGKLVRKSLETDLTGWRNFI
jgi:hypothetical protein